jgi:hypothetical protein
MAVSGADCCQYPDEYRWTVVVDNADSPDVMFEPWMAGSVNKYNK